MQFTLPHTCGECRHRDHYFLMYTLAGNGNHQEIDALIENDMFWEHGAASIRWNSPLSEVAHKNEDKLHNAVDWNSNNMQPIWVDPIVGEDIIKNVKIMAKRAIAHSDKDCRYFGIYKDVLRWRIRGMLQEDAIMELKKDVTFFKDCAIIEKTSMLSEMICRHTSVGLLKCRNNVDNWEIPTAYINENILILFSILKYDIPKPPSPPLMVEIGIQTVEDHRE
jgi:hypothetical protein